MARKLRVHLFELWERALFWVTRAKEGMSFRVIEKRLKKPGFKRIERRPT